MASINHQFFYYIQKDRYNLLIINGHLFSLVGVAGFLYMSILSVLSGELLM